MCVVSMIHDHFEPKIPQMPWQPNIWPPQGGTVTLVEPPASAAEVQALRDEVTRLSKVIDDFRKAKEAAETVDALTNQPDCIDPKKAPLIERVNDLEKRLAAVKREIGM